MKSSEAGEAGAVEQNMEKQQQSLTQCLSFVVSHYQAVMVIDQPLLATIND